MRRYVMLAVRALVGWPPPAQGQAPAERERALVLHVTVEAPHEVVGIRVPGGPLEIVRRGRPREGEPR
jgi:hypothetical protein